MLRGLDFKNRTPKMSYIRTIFLFLNWLFFSMNTLYSQNWQMEGNPDDPLSRFYSDATENVLYVGGSFVYFDSILVNGIIRWNGSEIHPLDMGLKGNCGPNACYAPEMIIKYNNEIYVGPTLNNIDDISVKGVARWNGTKWLDLDGGLIEVMYGNDGLAVDGYIHNGQLLIGGAFEKAGSDTIYSLAAWDGSNWSGMGVPASTPGSLHGITSIYYYKDDLYVAGNFVMNLDGETTHDVAVLKDGAWHPVAGGLKGGNSYVNDMVVFKDELYICGYFSSTAGNIGNKIMRWDGAQWKDVAGGLCSPFNIAERMMVYDGKLYVVGIFDCVGNGIPASCIATWDGERWCSFGDSKFNNKIRDVAAWNNDIYIGGGFTEIDGQPVKYFAKWVGDHSTDTCSPPVVAAPEMKEDAAYTLSIGPNPAHSSLTLLLEGSARSGKPVRFSVFNALGQEVWSVVSRLGKEEVSLAGWPSGAYVTRAESEQGVVAKAFVKE